MPEKMTEHERLLAEWLGASEREHECLLAHHRAKADSDAAWARLKAHDAALRRESES